MSEAPVQPVRVEAKPARNVEKVKPKGRKLSSEQKKTLTDVNKHKYEEFFSNDWDQAAIIRYFEIIGEAVSNINEEFKKTLPDIEWRDMNDFRNFLIHDYMDIDVKIVWKAMTVDIPALKQKIDKILS